MFNTGWVELTNYASSGGGTAWGTPSNAATENSVCTQSSNIPTGTTSQDLQGKLLNPALRTGSQVKGIQARIKRATFNIFSYDIRDNVVSMIIGNSITGDNKAFTGVIYPFGDSSVCDSTWSSTYGSSTDLWGIGLTFDPKMNRSTTGFNVKIRNHQPTVVVSGHVDVCQLTIHYNPTGMFMAM